LWEECQRDLCGEIKMNEIATIVSVMGDDAYFKMASISLRSFLKNNVSADLFIFTDNFDRVDKLKNVSPGRVHIVDMPERFKRHKDVINDLIKRGTSEEDMKIHAEGFGYFHNHLFASSLVPIAEDYLKDRKYSHILKIDVDSYFAGGDMMVLVKEEIRSAPGFDLYLVARQHDLMCPYGGGAPGTGFTLWRKGSNFAVRYLERFTGNFQNTILRMRGKGLLHIKILDRPGYHFVYPFKNARETNREFTKEIASEFLPAYFHLSGRDALENMKIMDKWFGDESDETA